MAGNQQAKKKANSSASSVDAGLDHGVGLVRERFDWYKDRFRQMVSITLASVIVAVVSVTANIMFITHPKPQIYFATTTDGRIIQMTPLTRPTLDETSLLNWVAKASVAPFNIDYLHYRSQLQALQPNFTASGWAKFVSAMSEKLIPEVRDSRMLVSAVVSGSPVETVERIESGRLAQWIQVPIVVTYIVGSRTVVQNLLIKVVIIRGSVVKHPHGWAIQSFVPTTRT